MKKRLILIALRIVLWRVALLWCKTLKIVRVNADQFDELSRNGKNVIVTFWHDSMFVGWFLHRPQTNWKISALVSQSNDGEFLSTILERWNYTMIRGSSHTGGKEAMQLMVDEVENGNSLAITPDGPRGPRHEMKMGAVRVAQRTGVPLILVGIATLKKKQLRSWDKFEVPRPFSTVVAKYSEPIIVPKELNNELLDEFKRTMQNVMTKLTEEASELSVTLGGSK
ncbi:MAG: lysophospholipid acyltransferase family protein [Bacteroidota bacterium]|nr:lysophospholipid acyltransferase family protein [Bacteroidota bacterium]